MRYWCIRKKLSSGKEATLPDQGNANTISGIVLKGAGGFYHVLITKLENYGNKVLVAKVRGRLRRETDIIYSGDRVLLEPVADGETLAGREMVKAMIVDILPRRNHLLRPKVANISQAVLVLAAQNPRPDWLLLDRMLVMVLSMEVNPLICFNKWDLPDASEQSEINRELAAYETAGFLVIRASAKKTEGIVELSSCLQKQISVFAGPSGVGKSSLINALSPELGLLTGDISRRLGRGKHTTRQVEILLMDQNAMVADTPGFSLLDLPDDLTEADLPGLYPDFSAFGPCRFDGCLHHKEPDCAIKKAESEQLIGSGRYQRYLALLTEIKERKIKY